MICFIYCINLIDFVPDSPDNIFGDHMKKGRSKVYRDSEKVPLGESDELAMI